jgi:hypothetical protein
VSENDGEVEGRDGLPRWIGPALMLGASLLTLVIVFLPWAQIEVSDTNLDVRNGWYSGLQLMLPLLLILLMIAPVVVSVLALTGRGTGRRTLEVGLCSFAFGMEFLLLCALLALNAGLQDLAGKVDLFKIGLGPVFWLAFVLLAFNIIGLVMTGRSSKRAGVPAEELAR